MEIGDSNGELKEELELGTWELELGTWELELGTWNLGIGTWDLELGTWDLELGNWMGAVSTSVQKCPEVSRSVQKYGMC